MIEKLPFPPFKDPIRPRKRTTSKFFVAPTKEDATTGRFMEAGDDYGKGFNVPFGKEKASFKNTPVPQKAKCFPLDPPR